mmetsp:Transcript_16761/g.41279  ORF Transcript_16761/g.41279 Transcript_16761/m.41279 type:complete len:342 (-) Transcript_16761:1446-2471(-)
MARTFPNPGPFFLLFLALQHRRQAQQEEQDDRDGDGEVPKLLTLPPLAAALLTHGSGLLALAHRRLRGAGGGVVPLAGSDERSVRSPSGPRGSLGGGAHVLLLGVRRSLCLLRRCRPPHTSSPLRLALGHPPLTVLGLAHTCQGTFPRHTLHLFLVSLSTLQRSRRCRRRNFVRGDRLRGDVPAVQRLCLRHGRHGFGRAEIRHGRGFAALGVGLVFCARLCHCRFFRLLRRRRRPLVLCEFFLGSRRRSPVGLLGRRLGTLLGLLRLERGHPVLLLTRRRLLCDFRACAFGRLLYLPLRLLLGPVPRRRPLLVHAAHRLEVLAAVGAAHIQARVHVLHLF